MTSEENEKKVSYTTRLLKLKLEEIKEVAEKLNQMEEAKRISPKVKEFFCGLPVFDILHKGFEEVMSLSCRVNSLSHDDLQYLDSQDFGTYIRRLRGDVAFLIEEVIVRHLSTYDSIPCDITISEFLEGPFYGEVHKIKGAT
ncbi:MAG: hypothetical protein HYW70_00330 [Candidatus Nealsonbacteria bacterium]|nr:hypothetical protein [Candidatus Nealsonbacteria bacterium]